MIPTERLLYKLDAKLNKLASHKNQLIPLENKIFALREANIRLIKKKVNINNLYKLGFDAFKSRYEDLQGLVIPYETIKVEPTSEILPSVKFNVGDLKNKYYLPVDIIAKASKGTCTNKNVYVPRIIKHGDLTTLINNPNYSPSFEYEETLAVISSDNVIIYVGDFKVEEVEISYIRYPKEINVEGWVDLDGKEGVNQDCELPEYLEDELLELAVMELGINTDNPAGQSALGKSQYSE